MGVSFLPINYQKKLFVIIRKLSLKISKGIFTVEGLHIPQGTDKGISMCLGEKL